MSGIETTSDSRQWSEWCRRGGIDDVYYRLEYHQIWQNEEQGDPVGVRFQCDEGTVLYPVVRVRLDELEGGDGMIDVRTPYDFGGPRAVGESPPELLERFREPWRMLLEEWNAVTEFARLHPLGMEEIPEDAEYHTDTFVVDLEPGYPEIRDSYKSSFAGQLAQAEQNGLTVDIDQLPSESTRETFCRLYHGTMKRVGADSFYFFSDQTLRSLMNLPEMRVATAMDHGEPVAAALVLRSGSDSFYYLAGSRRDALDRRPNNILLDRIIRDGIRRGERYFHLGGGDSGVRHFKSQMANDTVPYYLLKRTHNPAAYRRLCEAADVDPEQTFPAYRPALLKDDR